MFQDVQTASLILLWLPAFIPHRSVFAAELTGLSWDRPCHQNALDLVTIERNTFIGPEQRSVFDRLMRACRVGRCRLNLNGCPFTGLAFEHHVSGITTAGAGTLITSPLD